MALLCTSFTGDRTCGPVKPRRFAVNRARVSVARFILDRNAARLAAVKRLIKRTGAGDNTTSARDRTPGPLAPLAFHAVDGAFEGVTILGFLKSATCVALVFGLCANLTGTGLCASAASQGTVAPGIPGIFHAVDGLRIAQVSVLQLNGTALRNRLIVVVRAGVLQAKGDYIAATTGVAVEVFFVVESSETRISGTANFTRLASFIEDTLPGACAVLVLASAVLALEGTVTVALEELESARRYLSVAVLHGSVTNVTCNGTSP
jgi:hypothetical protein